MFSFEIYDDSVGSWERTSCGYLVRIKIELHLLQNTKGSSNGSLVYVF